MFYRLRKSLSYGYFRLATRGLDDTPTVRARENAPCEAHTMLGRHDVTMYLLAVKSLLSFEPELAVVVHSDGSLTAHDEARIAANVSGVQFVRYELAEQRAKTELTGSLLAKWRLHDAAYRRLIDVELWRSRDRVIILDSDVLTIRRPDEVLAWIKGGSKPFLLGQPTPGAEREDLSATAHVQKRFLHLVPDLSRATGNSPRFLQGTTAGFCGYAHELSLPRIEEALRASLELGLPMEQWGGDQCLIVYLLSAAGAERLPQDRYLNFEPSLKSQMDRAVMVHFYGTHRFHAGTYPRLAADTVRRLRRVERVSESAAMR